MQGKRVVVTGGAGGLGVAVVAGLRGAGADVEAPASADLDLTNEDQVTRFYAALPDLWASVHLVGGFAMKPIADTTLDDLQAMLRLNTVTCFLSCRESVRTFRRAGGDGGRIVNVAARPALSPVGGMIAYSASKAAVASLTQSLAEEVKGEGILVNAIVPSIIDTPANRRSMPKADFASWPTPDEIAATIGWLVSPANTLTSGTLVPVYGKA
jgi:NAD(P)-dependent dehydrogenase (short-subunit alcohol dehydrogenase family)